MTTEEEVPRLPKFHLKKVLRTRRKILRVLKHFTDGISRQGRDFESMILEVSAVLPKGVSVHAVSRVMAPFAGKEFTSTDAATLSWRLAGNIEFLQQKTIADFPDWTRQPSSYWAAVRVLAYQPRLSVKQKRLCSYRLRFISGLPSGVIYEVVVPLAFVKSVLAPLAGFSKPWGDAPMSHPSEIVGFWLAVLLPPVIDEHRCSMPKVSKFSATPSMVAENRCLVKARRRIDFDCPEGFTLDDLPCFECPFGQDHCPVSVHEKTYFTRFCSTCSRETYHDPSNRDRCTVCLQL